MLKKHTGQKEIKKSFEGEIDTVLGEYKLFSTKTNLYLIQYKN